ncbi:MAG TPA: ABC transporter substrate-binding protein [Candidatus Binatia bacterium]|nr:ABC transporter substrate-binding protein [Candidatus Binatia bacterium]
MPHAGLVVVLPSDPQSLDPRFGTDANSARLADLLHVALTRPGSDGRRVPALAARWEVPDPRTFVFHLRTDFRFPDGSPVTATDVRATYEAVLDPTIASPRRGALAVLSAIETPDDATVVLHTREPFTALLDATGLGVLPAARARDQTEVAIGAGPFRLVEAVRGERIVLRPNPGFPGGPPRIDPLVVRIVPDEVVRVLELRRGGAGLLEDAPEPEVLEWLRRDPALRVTRVPGTSFAYLALNLRDPRLAQRRVRQAIALALDRRALVRFVLGGAARPASGLLAPEHWAYAPAPIPPHDVRRARRLLDRAGFRDPDGPGPRPRFRLVYKTSTDVARRRLAEAIQAALAEVGIAVEIRSYEWGTLYADVRRGNFQLSALTWVGVGDPDLYYLTFHSTMRPPAGYNRGGYASGVMDRLTTEGRRTLDPERRRAVYARIQRRAAHDLPVVPLWWEDRIVVATRRLSGFVPAADGALDSLARASLD